MKKIEWQLYHNGDGSLTAACKEVVHYMQRKNANGQEIISWLQEHSELTFGGRQSKFVREQLERVRLGRKKRQRVKL